MATRARATETEEMERSEATEQAPEQVRVVRYRGAGTRRIITAEEWTSVGANGTPTTEWNFHNSFAIPAREFSEEALAYIRRDDKFVIEG